MKHCLGSTRRYHISDCFSDAFACRHVVFLLNLVPWTLERSDLNQSRGSGGQQPPSGFKKMKWPRKANHAGVCKKKSCMQVFDPKKNRLVKKNKRKNPNRADLADPARKPYVSTHFNGFGALPSSPLDSHRDFEPFGILHVDFAQFPTSFMQILIGNRPDRPEIDSNIDRKLTPIPKNVVIMKMFASKFCAEWSGR